MMNKKTWGIFCKGNEIENVKEKLTKRGHDIFEVRPLTMSEKLTYIKDPILFANEPHVVMFHATTLQYKWLLFRNGYSKVF